MTDLAPPQNEQFEIGVLGTLQMTAAPMGELLTVVGLKPDHFYKPRHQAIFRAMVGLADRGEPIDPATVVGELERAHVLDEAGGAPYIHSLQTMVASAGSIVTYAERIVEDYRFRTQMAAGRKITESAAARDAEGVAAAEGQLAVPVSQDILETDEERAEAIWRHLQSNDVDLIPMPFGRMNEMVGGHWPGTFMVVIGWSGHGKSVLVDQILEKASAHGARCALYRTEQTHQKRDMRLIARRTDIPLMRLMFNDLTEDERNEAMRAMRSLPFQMLGAGGMTAREIGRDIRRRGWDLCAVDLLNATTGTDAKDIDRNIAYLAGVAAKTNTIIVGAQHLNRFNMEKGAYPHEPLISDIRGSSAIHDLSDVVVSVHRFQDETEELQPPGEPARPPKKGENGRINFLKVKEGIDGYFDVRFNGSRMRFELPAVPGTVGGIR